MSEQVKVTQLLSIKRNQCDDNFQLQCIDSDNEDYTTLTFQLSENELREFRSAISDVLHKDKDHVTIQVR